MGVDDESGTNGSIVFHVLADGTDIFASGVLTGGATHQSINLDVTVDRLNQGVSDADDGINSACGLGGRLVVVSNQCPRRRRCPPGCLPVRECRSSFPGRGWQRGHYNIKRALVPTGTYTNIAVSLLPAYADSNVISGTTYYYEVSAVSSLGESSNWVATSAYACAPPAVPSGVTAVASNLTVTISWNPVPGATSYNLARALSSTPYSTIATGLTATNYTDRNVSSGTNYSYVVFANNSCTQSGPSAYANATPILPVGFIGIQPTGTNLLLTWPQGILLQATNLTGPWVTNPSRHYIIRVKNIAGVIAALPVWIVALALPL